MPLNAAWAMCGGSSPDKDGGTGSVVGATVSSPDAGVFRSVFRNASRATDAGTYIDVRCVGLAFPINKAITCKITTSSRCFEYRTNSNCLNQHGLGVFAKKELVIAGIRKGHCITNGGTAFLVF